MHIHPIRTRTLIPPKDSFFDALCESITEIPEKSILALSSKAIAIGEGRCVPIISQEEVRLQKEKLAQQEADFFVQREEMYGRHFTIIHGSLMGSAGIDESNGNNHLVLWPENPMYAAQEYHAKLQEKYGVAELGIVITDSHSIPLHNGAIGLAIGYAGFLPIRDYRGAEDLFGRAFKVERFNIADSVAVAATCVMGEGNESTPAALITDMPQVTFTNQTPTDPFLELTVSREDDYFRPFLDLASWQKGGGGYHL